MPVSVWPVLNFLKFVVLVIRLLAMAGPYNPRNRPIVDAILVQALFGTAIPEVTRVEPVLHGLKLLRDQRLVAWKLHAI